MSLVSKDQSDLILSHMPGFKLSKDMINYIAGFMTNLDVIMWTAACGFKFKPSFKYAREARRTDQWHHFKWLLRNGCGWDPAFTKNANYIAYSKVDLDFLLEYALAARKIKGWTILKNVNILELAYDFGNLDLFKVNYLELDRKDLSSGLLDKMVIADDVAVIEWLHGQHCMHAGLIKKILTKALLDQSPRLVKYVAFNYPNIVEPTINQIYGLIRSKVLDNGIGYLDWLMDQELNVNHLNLFNIALSIISDEDQRELFWQVLQRAVSCKIIPQLDFMEAVISITLHANVTLGLRLLNLIICSLSADILTRLMTMTTNTIYHRLKYRQHVCEVMQILKQAGGVVGTQHITTAIENKDLALVKWCINNSDVVIDFSIMYRAQTADPTEIFVYLKQVQTDRCK